VAVVAESDNDLAVDIINHTGVDGMVEQVLADLVLLDVGTIRHHATLGDKKRELRGGANRGYSADAGEMNKMPR
jgi:hypothetical protein